MTQSEIKDAALGWVVRTNDPDFDDWEGFTVWLERDPAHADAYHALLASEADVRPYLDAVTKPAASGERLPGPRDAQRRTRRVAAWLLPSAAAAALAVVLAPRVMTDSYATAPGEQRVIALGGRDEIVMNGGTRIELSGLTKRRVRLQDGQILVRLQEPGAAGVTVSSGDLSLVDVGTVFEVSRTGPTTQVSVSEGAVIADPRGANLRLDVGEALEAADGATTLRTIPADARSVGGFARGQLIYRNASVSRVVRDLELTTGLDFSESSTISTLRFTGALSVAEVKRDPRSLEPLLGVTMQRSGRVWQLNKRD